MRRVFVDTSVLFPFSVMDLFLALTEDAVHQVLWTDELLEEWERVIVRERRRSADTAASVVAAVRDSFASVESIRAFTDTWSVRCLARTRLIILTRQPRLEPLSTR